MSETLLAIDGFDEEKVDRLAALGIISVFDIEEIGAEVIAEELELDPELVASTVQICADKAKVVAEMQAKEKAEAEARRKQEEEAAARLLAGDQTPVDAEADAAAASILGEAPPPPTADDQPPAADGPQTTQDNPVPTQEDDARAADILGQ